MRCLVSLACLTAFARSLLSAGEASTVLLQSGSRQTALMELFTSEGCSSCPPAEAWLGGFVNRPELWRDFVPVVWHVDYWDGLGWPDRFASKANTQRQETYAATWHHPGVYTPGFVLNGAEWRRWSSPREIGGWSKPDVGTLVVKQAGTNSYTLTFTPKVKTPRALDATLAWLGSDLISDVRRGENAGRKLRHHFVALQNVSGGLREVDGNYQVVMSLPMPEKRDAEHLSLVAWVSPRGELAPIQAVGGWVKR